MDHYFGQITADPEWQLLWRFMACSKITPVVLYLWAASFAKMPEGLLQGKTFALTPSPSLLFPPAPSPEFERYDGDWRTHNLVPIDPYRVCSIVTLSLHCSILFPVWLFRSGYWLSKKFLGNRPISIKWYSSDWNLLSFQRSLQR